MRRECLQKLFETFLHRRFVYSSLFIHSFTHVFISVWTRGYWFYTLGYNPTLHYLFVSWLVPDIATGSLSGKFLCPFDITHHFVYLSPRETLILTLNTGEATGEVWEGDNTPFTLNTASHGCKVDNKLHCGKLGRRELARWLLSVGEGWRWLEKQGATMEMRMGRTWYIIYRLRLQCFLINWRWCMRERESKVTPRFLFRAME